MIHRHAPLAISFAAVAALAAATPAAAGHERLLGLRLDVHARVHDVLRELHRVPHRIHARHRAHLDVFLGGRNYYAPHRHHHATYRFPVRVAGAVAYRPYVYCDDVLFSPSGARFELWYEGGHGHGAYWCGHCHRYYAQRHSHYRYEPRPRHYAPEWRYRDDHRRYGHDKRWDRRNHRYDHDEKWDRRDHRRGHDKKWDRRDGRRDRDDRDDREHRRRGRGRDD
jgi:hypothetical protein